MNEVAVRIMQGSMMSESMLIYTPTASGRKSKVLGLHLTLQLQKALQAFRQKRNSRQIVSYIR